MVVSALRSCPPLVLGVGGTLTAHPDTPVSGSWNSGMLFAFGFGYS